MNLLHAIGKHDWSYFGRMVCSLAVDKEDPSYKERPLYRQCQFCNRLERNFGDYYGDSWKKVLRIYPGDKKKKEK